MDFVKSIGSSVVQKFDSFQGSELEKKVKDATSNENWGSSGTIKNEIADATHDYQGFREIMGVLWKRMAEKDNNWRIVFKSLELLMFLVKCGHDRVVEEVRDHQYTLKLLQNFSFIDPTNGQDKGRGVRQLAQQILELVADTKRLREARSEALKQRKKLQDVNKSNLGSDNGTFGTYNSSSNFKSRSSDDYNSSYRDRDHDRGDEEEEATKENKTKRKSKSKSKDKDDNFDAWDDDESSTKKKKKRK